ncbi:hypothetical protein F5B19DRAFT_479175 [Rostrohypoxylon terebratum]|nr:hypothetical protein F5B19DRAFT_479175 [Rostrohypoxylon terebratum]
MKLYLLSLSIGSSHLHSRLLRYSNEPQHSEYLKPDTILRQAPMYRYLSTKKDPRPICLGPLFISFDNIEESHTPKSTCNRTPTARRGINHRDSSSEVSICVRLQPEALGNPLANDWVKWLSSVPSGAQDINIEYRLGKWPDHSQSDPLYINSYSSDVSRPIPRNNYLALSTTIKLDPHDGSSSLVSLPMVEESDNDLKCPHCQFRPTGKPSKLKAYLRKHISTHDRPKYAGEVCDKAYTRPDNLDVHVRKSHRAKRRRGSAGNARNVTSADSTRTFSYLLQDIKLMNHAQSRPLDESNPDTSGFIASFV